MGNLHKLVNLKPERGIFALKEGMPKIWGWFSKNLFEQRLTLFITHALSLTLTGKRADAMATLHNNRVLLVASIDLISRQARKYGK